MGGCASKCCCLCCIGQYKEYKCYENPECGNPRCGPCSATGLYIPVPSSHNKEACMLDAKVLYEAMKGAGTKDSVLARMFGQRTSDQLQSIKKVFKEMYEIELEDMLKDETSGSWEDLLVMSLLPVNERDARMVHDAIDGLGTDDIYLRFLLTGKNWKDLREMELSYETLYGKPLVDAVKDDTSLNYASTLYAVIRKAEYLAERLHKAISRPGTDDQRIIRIFTGYPRSNGVMRDILNGEEDHLNMGTLGALNAIAQNPDLQDIKQAYAHMYKKPLEDDIKSETSFGFKTLLLELLKDPMESLADNFREAFSGAGTNDKMLIELCATRTRLDIIAASRIYEAKYGESLEAGIMRETSGDYCQTLLMCSEPLGSSMAKALVEAYDGAGTDDHVTITLLNNRSRSIMREFAEAFAKLYGKSLERATKSETSFWYRRALVYNIRQAHEGLMWVPEPHIARYRDV